MTEGFLRRACQSAALMWIGASFCTLAVTAHADEPRWTLNSAENSKLPPGFRQFAIPRSDGSTQTAFLAHFDANPDSRKPLLIYLDGSGAQSVFTAVGEKIGYGTAGVVGRRACQEYHVLIPEKRGVKFAEHQQYGSAVGASDEYQQFATLEGRVAEVRNLLDAVLSQPTVDPGRVLLIGHSEGAPVAAAVAVADPRVTHVAYLAGNGPSQFFDLIVLQRKQLARDGKSPAEIENMVQQLEAEFRKILAEPQSTTEFFAGHANRRWTSFAQHPPVESLLRGKARLFLAHGTEDTAVPIESFDLLTVDLLRAGRADVTVHRYPGLDHSLMDPNAEKKMPLGNVLPEILQWAANTNNGTSAASTRPTQNQP